MRLSTNWCVLGILVCRHRFRGLRVPAEGMLLARLPAMGRGVMAAYNSANAVEFFCYSGLPSGCRIREGAYRKVRLSRSAFATRAIKIGKGLKVPVALPDIYFPSAAAALFSNPSLLPGRPR